MKDRTFFDIGCLLMADANGEDIRSTDVKQAAAEYRHRDDAWSTAMCGLARDIFDLTEGEGSRQSHFVRGVVKQAALGNTDAVGLRGILADATESALGLELGMEKVALKGAGGTIFSGIRAGTAVSPALLKALLFSAAATGAGAGTVAWGLNRDAKEDDEELERMQAQIDTYNRISKEIGSKLRERGVDMDAGARL
jgi:hypothetical protein